MTEQEKLSIKRDVMAYCQAQRMLQSDLCDLNDENFLRTIAKPLFDIFRVENPEWQKEKYSNFWGMTEAMGDELSKLCDMQQDSIQALNSLLGKQPDRLLENQDGKNKLSPNFRLVERAEVALSYKPANKDNQMAPHLHLTY